MGRSCAIGLVFCATCAWAQVTGDSVITTFAGTAWTFPDAAAGLNAPIGAVAQPQFDSHGNLIFADPGNQIVGRLNPDGTVSIIAGNGIRGYSGDGGPARSAALNQPDGVALDPAGNIYIADASNNRIRLVTPDGLISTYAGTGVAGTSGDGGPATDARIHALGTIVVGPDGAVYVEDLNTIRRISADGIITTYAGNGSAGRGGENVPATSAPLSLNNTGIAFDAAGNLFIADGGNNWVRKVTPAGIISTVAGSGVSGTADGPALQAQFEGPKAVAFDAAGNLYVSDNTSRIRMVSGGVVSEFAGTGGFGFTGDGGQAVNAQFRFITGLLFDSRGALYVGDSGNNRIRVIAPNGVINTIVGNGQFRLSPDGTPALNAYLYVPSGIAFDPAGNLLVPDSQSARLQRVRVNGTIQGVAGNGVRGGSTSGVARNVPIGAVRSAVGDAAGNVYFTDNDFSRVARVAPDGTLSIFVDRDVVNFPTGLTLDAAGNLYIADTGNHVIRKATPAGMLTVIAGNGKPGLSGDNGDATKAQLSGPAAVAFDPAGNLIIADSGNARLRKVTPAGVITTIAGNGNTPALGALASGSGIGSPQTLAIDAAGNIYFTIINTSRVLRLDAATGLLVAVAGTGIVGYSGDGGPGSAAAVTASGVALDKSGNLYIADSGVGRIRVLLKAPPSVTVLPRTLNFQANSGGDIAGAQLANVSSSLAGLLFTASADQPWVTLTSGVASAPTGIQIAADPTGLDPGTYTSTVTISSPGLTAPLTTISVTFTVVKPLPPQLGLDTQGLTFSATAGGDLQTRSFHVLNSGGGTLDFSVAVSGSGSASILVDTQTGFVQPSSPASIVVTVDPTILPPGTYEAVVTISSSATGATLTIPLTITLAARTQRMALSQRGLLFTAVQGGGVTPPQSFAVVNAGQGVFAWSAAASTFPGASGWLSVTPDSGFSDTQATVSVNPSGIAPGVYYGLVRVSTSDASDSPQDVEVVLNLLSSDQDPGAVVGPSGLVFTTVARAANPGSQTFTITNLSPSPARFALGTVTLDGGSWIQAVPDRGTIAGAGSQDITVQLDSTGLAAGVYNGQVALQVESTPRTVRLLLVVAATPVSVSGGRAAGGCSPSMLLPVFTSFLQDFTVPAAWPVPLEVRVVDDCGSPQTTGRVVTTFSNGDPPLSLVSLKDGRWQGTWFSGNARAAQIAVTATAQQDAPSIRGALTYTGTVQANDQIPSITPGGVRNAAPSLDQAPLAPGSLISIPGAAFGFGPVSASNLPLDSSLGGTQVILAGQLLPLLYSSSGLINAVVPYDIDPNGQYTLMVVRGSAASGPEPVTVAAAQPAVVKVDASGDASVVQSFWTLMLSGAALDPASIAPGAAVGPGDPLTIYCSGLGALDAPVDAAAAASAAPPNVANPVTVTIGGTSAAVSAATLVPGYTGIYQVTITVPAGIPSGPAPLVVSVSGQASIPVNLTLR